MLSEQLKSYIFAKGIPEGVWVKYVVPGDDLGLISSLYRSDFDLRAAALNTVSGNAMKWLVSKGYVPCQYDIDNHLNESLIIWSNSIGFRFPLSERKRCMPLPIVLDHFDTYGLGIISRRPMKASRVLIR